MRSFPHRVAIAMAWILLAIVIVAMVTEGAR